MSLLTIISGVGQSLYIDPAATSVLISSITAIVVALSATFIIMWRKLKKKVKKTFHIDENANKEVEADLVVLDESVQTKQTTETPENNQTQIEANEAQEISTNPQNNQNIEQPQENATQAEQPQSQPEEIKTEQTQEEKPENTNQN